MLGIGNPGEEYAGTRHNCGFQVLDRLAERAGVSFRRGRLKYRAATGRLGPVPALLVKPETYVNLTGVLVPVLLREQDAGPSDLLVVCDDLNLRAGQLRVRATGSAGGHHGLESIIEHLGGSQAFPRIRIGIGRGAGDQAGYVLDRFRKEELPLFEEAFTRAADAAICWAGDGLEACMSRFNRKAEAGG